MNPSLQSPSDEQAQPNPQFTSRRERRLAEQRQQAASAPVIPSAPTAASNPFRVPVREVSVVAEPVSDVRTASAFTRPRARRRPFRTVLTLTAVTGMFAVAALPAYAMVQDAGATVSADGEVASAQSFAVQTEAGASVTRDGYSATDPAELAAAYSDPLRASFSQEYLDSGAAELGDDYPWPYEVPASQGGGLSPLNYYYRECVDFVAWRLNRDAGTPTAPFTYVWSDLTPGGGNGRQWPAAWARHGWTISDVPIIGSVASFPAENHVAYVKAVMGDQVLIEEYNYIPHKYGQRIVPISDVTSFLYPPGT